MRLKQYIVENMEQPTKEMVQFYEKRTKEHINRVVKNLSTIAKERDVILDKGALLARGKSHDKSKYSTKERLPYMVNMVA